MERSPQNDELLNVLAFTFIQLKDYPLWEGGKKKDTLLMITQLSYEGPNIVPPVSIAVLQYC